MKKFLYIFLILNLFIISACDSSENSSSESIVIPKIITINGERVVYAGKDAVQFTAILNPDNFTTEKITWSSDNDTVGTIDSNGLFTAKNKGTVNITASAGGVTSEPYNVTVILPVESVSVSSSNQKEINIGQKVEYTFEVTPKDAQYESVTWSVDNTSIANIDIDTGILIGNTRGIVNVNVTVDGITSEPFPVTVLLPVENVTINGPDSLYVSEKASYTFNVEPNDSDIKNITWSVDKKTLASIDSSTGELTAKTNVGQVIVTVNVDGKEANKLVNIIKTLEIKGNNITAIGGQITLTPLYSLTNNLTWKSSKPDVATVENGVVTGVSTGTTDITVSENGNTSAAFTITIKDVPNGYEVDENGAYNVYSVEGFKKWIEAVTTNSSTDCNLYSDIDFSTSMPDMPEIAYKGTFNGNGHIIKNYTINNGSSFIEELNGGKILNVTFDDIFTSNDYFSFSGIVASTVIQGTIENVHVKNSDISVRNGKLAVGMIAAKATSSVIKNCSITNSDISLYNDIYIYEGVGSIAGMIDEGSIVSGCYIDNVTINKASFNGNIEGLGGIVGKQVNSTVIGCGVVNIKMMSFTLDPYQINYVGGLIGVNDDVNSNIHASFFNGSIWARYYSGIDFGKFTGTSSTIYVKDIEGAMEIINGNNTIMIDNPIIMEDTATWEQAVENMNKYLTDNGYTDFSFRYDESKGYPVIDYIK